MGWVVARGNGQYTNCTVGEFEVYNRILSDSEILSNFNNRKTIYGY